MMGTVSGYLALALLGAEPAPTPQSAQPRPIACQARVITVDALAWRAALGDQVHSVSRKKGTTAWIARRSAPPALMKMATDKQIRQAQLVCPTPETRASCSLVKSTDYIQHQEVGQIAPAACDAGRPGESPVAVPLPEIRVEQARVDETFEVRCSARRLDQGVLAQVRLADSHVAAMHKVPSAGALEVADLELAEANPRAGYVVMAVGDALDAATHPLAPSVGLLHLAGLVVDGIDAATNPPVPLGQVEVPEVVAATVEGEWLVPGDSVLIVSLGVHTGTDATGKAVARDRLAILDFGDRPAPVSSDSADRPRADPVVRACESADSNPTPIALSRLNMPAVPDRSLPGAIDKDGQVVDLPPLPEAYAAADLNQISPGSPLASAQAPAVRPTGPAVDSQLARTTFEAPSGGTATEEVIGVDFDFGFSKDGTPHQGRMTQYASGKAVPQPARLAQLVEGFLRSGMGTCPVGDCTSAPEAGAECDDEAGDCPECPAGRSCPAQGEVPIGPVAASPDSTKIRASFAAALQNPGTTETQFIPLGKGLALEVRVRVVPEPKGDDDQARAFKPRRVEELALDSDNLRQAGDEWQRFWFLDQPSHLKPFPTAGTTKP